MNDKDRYVEALLERYRRLPGTLERVLRDDRRTAAALHHRRISLDVVHQAFVLALARRTFSAQPGALPPIRTLRYFLPVIDEIANHPLEPDYLLHIERRLRQAGSLPTNPT